MYKIILVPLDGSQLAESVLPHATALAQCAGAHIVLLRVAVTPLSAYAVAELPLAIDLQQDAEGDAVSYLFGIEAQLRAEGIPVTTKVELGVVAETILNSARNLHADLIAMSTHGRGGLARLVIGSVADEVMRHASVPVLLVRPAVAKRN